MATLYLIPTGISDFNVKLQLSIQVLERINKLNIFIVESAKEARRFLKAAGYIHSLNELTLFELNEHTNPAYLIDFLKPLLQGHDVGLMSDAGCPGVADPGAALVALAHHHNIEVKPLVGPNSILLALMASGLNGQSFAFNGYLPKEQSKRIKKIKSYERIAKENLQTQIFIETPYRSRHLFSDLIMHLEPSVKLCVAEGILSEAQVIKTKTVWDWRQGKTELKNIPTVFLFNFV